MAKQESKGASQKAKQQVEVEVLGKGTEKVSIDDNTTVGDLRKLLGQDHDVQATTKKGSQLNDGDVVRGDVKFTPNVEGGK